MENKRAKEIFFENNGQYYHMAHDGFWDEYKEYNIDKDTEEKWIHELTKLRLKEFKQTSDTRYLIPLVDYFNKYDFWDELLSLKLKGTYINKLVTVELLTKLLCKNRSKITNFKDKKLIMVNAVSKFIDENIPNEYADSYYHVEDRLEKVKKRLKMKL
jgi:hypothetical protein